MPPSPAVAPRASALNSALAPLRGGGPAGAGAGSPAVTGTGRGGRAGRGASAVRRGVSLSGKTPITRLPRARDPGGLPGPDCLRAAAGRRAGRASPATRIRDVPAPYIIAHLIVLTKSVTKSNER